MAGAIASGSFGRNNRRRRYQPMAEINVTPFVDVMLVLLIIFMVSAPLLTVGVPVDLPETEAKTLPGDTEPLVITIRNTGQIFLQDSEIPGVELVPKLTAVVANRHGLDERVFIRGDKASNYGEVMRVVGALNAAGFRHIAFVTDVEKGG